MRFSLAAALGLLTFGGVLCFLGTASDNVVPFYLSIAIALLFPVVMLVMALQGDASQRAFAVGALVPLLLNLFLSWEIYRDFDLRPSTHFVVYPAQQVQEDPFAPSETSADPCAPQPKPSYGPPTASRYWQFDAEARKQIDRTWSYSVLAFVCGGVALLTRVLLARGQLKSNNAPTSD